MVDLDTYLANTPLICAESSINETEHCFIDNLLSMGSLSAQFRVLSIEENNIANVYVV